MAALIGSLSLLVSILLIVAAARHWARGLFPESRTTSDSFLQIVLLVALLVAAMVVLTGSLGVLRRELLLLFSSLAFAGTKIGVHFQVLPATRLSREFRRSNWLVFWPTAPALLILLVDVLTTLPTSPVNWDAMTYHLYFPARWIQEGRLFHIPTVFGDNSAAFAPQNGALFFTWQMALLGSDATTNVAQVACLVFLAVVLYRFALLLGLRRQPAVMAAVTSVFLLPLRRWTLSANVDIFMVAFWFGAVYWLVRYLRERQFCKRQWGSLVSCGLATGLAMGSKTLGLVLGGLPAAAMGLFLLGARQFRQLVVFSGLVAITGGGWFFHHLWFYGNPLFPLDWGGPGFRFAGVYPSAALRQSVFRVDFDRWLEVILSQFGVTTCLLIAAGFAGLLTMPARGRLLGWGLAAFVILWPTYVFVVVPHNNQTRFLIPALVVSQLGWARWLDRVDHRRRRNGLFVLGLGLAWWSSRPDWTWLYSLDRLAVSGAGLLTWSLPALIATALGGWIPWRTRRSAGKARPGALAGQQNACAPFGTTPRAVQGPWTGLSGWPFGARLKWPGWLILGCIAWGLIALATHHAGQSRIAFLAQADYRGWATGYLMFNDPDASPRRIAYSGLNVPYTLTGPDLRHQVIYCNTQGEIGDGLYEHWLVEPRLYDSPRPGLYRGNDDYATWWKCLEQQAIDTVVLFATIPLERPSHWRMSGDFPLERDWMRQRPDLFHSVLRTPRAEIYSVTRPE